MASPAAGGDTTVTVIPKDTVPADPATSSFTGFFMDRWSPKSFTSPSSVTDKSLTGAAASVTIAVNTGEVVTRIPANYFGNNSNLWIGQLSNEPTLVNHLANFQPRIIRGPAGSVSDIYFFNAGKNVAPTDAPPMLLDQNGVAANAGYWYGKNTDSWTLSMDNYYKLLQQTNSTGVLTVNYGYARYGTSLNPVATAAHLAAEWVRYDNGRTKYWEIGNESFGEWEAGYRIDPAMNKDGQPAIITGNLYGSHFKVFADSMRKAAQEVGSSIFIGAVLYDSPPAAWTTNTIKTWNNGVFGAAGNSPDYYIVHSYFTNFNENSSAETIFSTAKDVPTTIKNYVTQGMAAAGIANKPVAMTEWNLFSSGSNQNVSHIAGMHAVLAMAEFIKLGYGAALRWDLGNGWSNGDDHGLFSLGDEPGAVSRWTPRPAFYYMYYFQKMIGDRLLASSVTGDNDVSAIASSFTSGQKAVIIVNKSKSVRTVEVQFQYFPPGAKFYYYVLAGGADNDNFSRMVYVNDKGPENNIAGGPSSSYTSINPFSTPASNGIKITMPVRSVVYMVVDKK